MNTKNLKGLEIGWQLAKDKMKNRIKKVCKCGKKFEVPPCFDRIQSCSRSCGATNNINRRGKKCPQMVNNHNPLWKGDNVGYSALHDWIRRRLIMSQTCRDCNEPKKLELANISGLYLRNVSDWEWLCRKCHLSKDAEKRRMNGRIRARELFEETKGGLGMHKYGRRISP